MDTLKAHSLRPKNTEPVQLIGFNSLNSSAPTDHKECLEDNLSFTGNKRLLNQTRQDSVPNPEGERVRLVKFKIKNSVHEPSGSKMDASSRREKLEKEREARMQRLQQEAAEWFSKVREENQKWRSGIPSTTKIMDPLEKVHRFFQEAKLGNDAFAQFVHDNQEEFDRLLDGSSESESFMQSFANRPSSFYSDLGSCLSAGDLLRERTRVNNNNNNRNTSYPAQKSCSSSGNGYVKDSCKESKQGNGLHCRTFSECSDAASEISTTTTTASSKSDNRSSNVKRTLKDLPPPFTNLRGLPHTNVLSSPVKMHCEPQRVNSQYRMLTSKSTFEYCQTTQTYRFSSHHLTQSCYEQGYESISESEDEEEESVEDGGSSHGPPSESTWDGDSTRDLDVDSGCPLHSEYESQKEKAEKNLSLLHKIVMELLTTECTYVDILHLLDQVFAFRVDQENRAHTMFSQEVVNQMFCNLKSLYKLHHDYFLPLLKDRLQNWEKERKIGDLMKNFAPFLKMYTEYVKNYDNAMNLINSWYQKQPRFAQIMDDIHRMDECGHLTLQHHMLTPIQRIPRYQLLLKDYLKKLPESSPDRADTEKALELVSTAAIHANEAMKKNDKIKKLLEIQEMIGGVVDLVSPTRELVKEGKIIKISARSGDHQERHLFLFNDLLLLCSQRRIANRVVSGPIFRVRARLEVEGLLIEEGDNLETANTFYIRHVGRAIELYTQTPEDKQAWMDAFGRAVHELIQRKSSLKHPEGLELGKRAPTFIKVDSVSHCMGCGKHFSTFTFKLKHHCHACGIVACSKCLSHKMPLACENNRVVRVCRQCFQAMSPEQALTPDLCTAGDHSPSKEDSDQPDSPIRSKSVLDVHPNDPSVTCGYLNLKGRGRTWVRRWFALHSDFVLYSFASQEEERALTSMPVPGFTVTQPAKGESGLEGRENVFKLYHQKKAYFFQANDPTDLLRWMSSLEKASQAEPFS